MAFIDEIIGDDDIKSVYIEEWKKDIFYKTFTLADGDWAEKFAKGKTGEYVIYTLIRKCLDSDGNKLFTVADKRKLMNNFDGDMLADILMRIKGVAVDETEETRLEVVAKN